MKPFSRREFVLVSALILLIGIGVVVFIVDEPTAPVAVGGIGNADAGWPVGAVHIEGDVVKAITPGVMVPLDLKVTNTQDFEMSVTAFTVAVHEVVAPNADDAHSCTVDDFTVVQAGSDLQITLAARATTMLSDLDIPSVMWPSVGMLDRPVNQDGCKAASLTLVYSASGTEGKL